MEIRLSSQAAPGRDVNEDGALAVGRLAVVFDGVTQAAVVDSGCIHSPAWYVRRLSAHLALACAGTPEGRLPDLLAEAIDRVAGEHRTTCDLTQPSTPAATVCMLREGPDQAEYLVLCDSTLVLDHGDRPTVITDARFHDLIARLRRETYPAGGTRSAAATAVKPVTAEKWRYINQPDGYWIAAADPQAAYQAVTGNVPLHGPDRLRRAALLTDGAAAAVDQFHLFDWTSLLDTLTAAGPAQLISQVRTAEYSTRLDDSRARYKRHDDATAALCLFEGNNR